MRATCPVYLSRHYLLIMSAEEFNPYSSALYNFLHSPVIPCLLAPNIFLSTLFSNTLNLCSSLKVRDLVSQPYNRNGDGHTIINIFLASGNFPGFECTINIQNLMEIVIARFEKIEIFNFICELSLILGVGEN